MTLNDITWLQVENTTNCNLWCPGCARNKKGFGLVDHLTVEDLKIEKFQQALVQLPNLKVVQFCGTYGDFAVAVNAMDHLDLALRHSEKIQIHTHGAVRNASWWTEVAKKLKNQDHDVWFAIDGLKGVHEVYRQGGDFDKAIENARAFINAGGNATWQFIPFAHNEHQIKECLKLSQQLGFKKFKLVIGIREYLEARHYKTGNIIGIEPWSRSEKTNPYHLIKERTLLTKSDCRYLQNKTVYLNANGKFSACCFLNIFRTGIPDIESEIETTPHHLCLQNCGNGATIHMQK